MEEVFKMYAMSDGSQDVEPVELDPDHEDFEANEEEEVETSSVLTSSDDDEPMIAEGEAVIVAVSTSRPAKKKSAKKKAAVEAIAAPDPNSGSDTTGSTGGKTAVKVPPKKATRILPMLVHPAGRSGVKRGTVSPGPSHPLRKIF